VMDFSDFFRSEADQLLRFCWILTLDGDEAADLAQDVMARAYERWDVLEQPDQNPAGWVRTVAVNLSRSRWRRVKRLRSLLPGLADSPHASVVASDPDLAGALATLAMRQREVIALRYWVDLPLAECAAAMDISLGSVKQHLARAHRNLAATIDPAVLQELIL
jgi:RNA polymerase sigma-70 factor (ECF subfamily)